MKKMRRKLACIISSVGGNELPYFTLTAIQDNSSIALNQNGTPNDIPLEYRVNNGAWLPYTYGDVISLNEGDNVQLRNSTDTVFYGFGTSSNDFCQFVMTGQVNASGNIMSLLDKSCESLTLGSRAFEKLFSGCGSLVNYLTEIPANSTQYNYSSLCFEFMFLNCENLVKAPRIRMQGTHNQYAQMFSNCSSVISHHVFTVTGAVVFSNNNSCESLTIDSETPPTIANNTITGLKADCIIYVPAASVDAYKAAQYWSARASYIQAIQ